MKSETIPPSPNYQCSLQVSEIFSCRKLPCCHSFNILPHWVGGSCLIYLCKVNHFRISMCFSRNWLGLNDLCQILQISNGEISLMRCYLYLLSGDISVWILTNVLYLLAEVHSRPSQALKIYLFGRLNNDFKVTLLASFVKKLKCQYVCRYPKCIFDLF